MARDGDARAAKPVWVEEARRFVAFVAAELRPRGPLVTPFNVISIPVMLMGAVLIVIRFTRGLGAVTNLTLESPLGFWIGFDVVTGVAFAGGAYLVTFAVYVMKADRYHPIVRATVLNGSLAYVFYAGALFLLAKSKIHPLWYSEFLPVLFLVSSVFAGLSMVIVEGTLSHRVFQDHLDRAHRAAFDEIVAGHSPGARRWAFFSTSSSRRWSSFTASTGRTSATGGAGGI